MRLLLFLLLFSLASYSQSYKEKISIVQYSAEFAKDGEIDLKNFKAYNTHHFDLIKDQKIFVKEDIQFVPTLILYQNGKEIKRIEAGISLKLQDDAVDLINKEIDDLLSSRF